jgi:long-chain acyl-CoA synthetase
LVIGEGVLPAVVFLTGATGFIGTQIAKRLVTQTDCKLIVLVREKEDEDAAFRLNRAWWEWPELLSSIGNRIEVLCGDLSKPHFGLEEVLYEKLVNNTTHIIHAAANTTPNLPYKELRGINVTGSANILELARAIKIDHGLTRLSHVSTAYVAGKRKGVINENDLAGASGFSSNYEKTKYESEVLFNAAKSELPISVFRPGLVVGDSKTGAVKTFNTVYFLLRLYLNGHLRIAPTSSKFRVNLVPVDYVAAVVANLSFDSQAEGLTFHVTPPWNKAPTAYELVAFVRFWAREKMNLKLPSVKFIPASESAVKSYYHFRSLFDSSDKNIGTAFRTLAPYFSQNQEFDRKNTDRLVGEYSFEWRDILPNILHYAVYYSFFHRSDRTVHEQILFRLQSSAKPIRYHEITKGRVVDYDTKKVRSEMLSAAASMKAMGIKKGDVVALVGFNSVRYLSLDVATGLLGCVSSPIYYTSPISEINKIIVETNAKLFFVGSPKILEAIDSITGDIPIVSFCKQLPKTHLLRRVISWSEFLDYGKNICSPSAAPVSFQELATIRYTFGSTGESKGACLEHGSLRFVAEALASLFPWKTRNTSASYLSFLPMNHVAEGITATYSPYFVPAALDLYYLEDYHNLQEALQKAKPNVLFAVPRFYEKIWDSLAANPLGQKYLKTKNTSIKRLLRNILRFAMLKKAGLNKCEQLIVGSACSSEKLLADFHNLGIEVHNAYGLSEAPLVAMNRLGSNNIDTVGQPLVGTDLQISHDGEILIKGPQVMRGYLNRKNELPFEDGWLTTGDIGEITTQGHLKILGRKKNIIVTSYGKKIPVDRIEASLKAIESVTEAIVVGDNQPFCSAVLWVDSQKTGFEAKIKLAIKILNEDLDKPSQVKRWVILKDSDLSEQKNIDDPLKTKRQELLKQVDDVVKLIYAPSINNRSEPVGRSVNPHIQTLF